MTRQELFEAHWADVHAVPVETMAQYRFVEKEGYRLPGMAAHYRTFCAALDVHPAAQALVGESGSQYTWVGFDFGAAL